MVSGEPIQIQIQYLNVIRLQMHPTDKLNISQYNDKFVPIFRVSCVNVYVLTYLLTYLLIFREQ